MTFTTIPISLYYKEDSANYEGRISTKKFKDSKFYILEPTVTPKLVTEFGKEMKIKEKHCRESGEN